MVEKALSLQEALKAYPKENNIDSVRAAEEERQLVLQRFPLEDWPVMPLENYALGQEKSEDTFCRWMEFKSLHLGSIRGGSARKLIIYKHKDKPGWYYDPAYKNEQDAWQAVRGAFVKAFKLAKEGDYNSIDELEPLQSGPALCLKVLHLYFPNDILPIYSKIHLLHFLRLLGQKEEELKEWEKKWEVVRLNCSLLAILRKIPEFEGWSTVEIMRFLYQWNDPRDSRRIVKIAPGTDAIYWPECLSGGYICVGWDEVGDLREFESKEAFRERFTEVFNETYNHHKPTLTKKANEVWTLIELEPGDIVIANQGTSRILAIGEVIEPGYDWMPGRNEFKHIVHIKWDTSYEKEIEIQKKWAFLTVAPVSFSLYESIVKGPGPIPVMPVDPIMRQIEDAIERKGQVILYGPPGTGKTYQARRFAVWWLLRQEGDQNPQAVLSEREAFEKAEKRLTTSPVTARVWWMVANKNKWHWNELFKEGRVKFSYGRLKRNFPLVQPGDLVVGYQATPDKRIIALAKISQGLEATDSDDSRIELVPLALVKDGLTFSELQGDSVLKNSEPMKNNNQGTLFSLTTDEAGYLLACLADRNPELQEYLDVDDSVGPLTRLTFHPSYSYEDFIEGFRPVDTGSGSLILRLEDGIFKRICREAQANPKKKYLLLVDEINRANVAKVFGEMITLIEKDKRGLIITLQQSKQSFTIPPNVYLLGTMNTSDRSIKLLDAALRRRFAFLELMPDIEILRGSKVGALSLDDFLEELNRRIARNEGREKQIGHSFLLDNSEPVNEPEELARRFRQEILPLLQEFCYDDYAALGEYLGDKIVDREARTLNVEVIGNTDSLLEALEEEFVRSGDEG
jgi:5-methylcytosine-specific restriction protein B